jgi:hypothetical protein
LYPSISQPTFDTERDFGPVKDHKGRSVTIKQNRGTVHAVLDLLMMRGDRLDICCLAALHFVIVMRRCE